MYLVEKIMGIELEKSPKDFCDLVNFEKKICVEVKRVSAITPKNIVHKIVDDTSSRKQLVKYIKLVQNIGYSVKYLFIKDSENYKLLDISELLKLIKEFRGEEVVNKLLEEASQEKKVSRGKNIDDKVRKEVVKLYMKGYSVKKIARILNISDRQVRKVLYSEGLLKLQEDTCPRCFSRMVRTDYGYVCNNCGYKIILT